MLKAGQIAHLDKNRNNNAPDNLAFMCLTHHDEYDSTSSQRKNFIAHEVREYKHELVSALDQAMVAPVTFGEATTSTLIVGQYIRIDQDSLSAEILVSQLLDGRFHVSGAAFRGPPNFHHGFLDFVSTCENGIIAYEEVFDGWTPERDPYRLSMRFTQFQAYVEDDDLNPNFGIGVSFNGIYKKAGGFGQYDPVI